MPCVVMGVLFRRASRRPVPEPIDRIVGFVGEGRDMRMIIRGWERERQLSGWVVGWAVSLGSAGVDDIVWFWKVGIWV